MTTLEQPLIQLGRGAEDNAFACMLCDLVRQNLQDKPHKVRDLEKLNARVALVADDVDVAVTLVFRSGTLTIHDGIVSVPDVTCRGPSEILFAMSNIPLTRRFGLPVAKKGDEEGRAVLRSVADATRNGTFHSYGALLHLPSMIRLTRVMSVNG